MKFAHLGTEFVGVQIGEAVIVVNPLYELGHCNAHGIVHGPVNTGGHDFVASAPRWNKTRNAPRCCNKLPRAAAPSIACWLKSLTAKSVTTSSAKPRKWIPAKLAPPKTWLKFFIVTSSSRRYRFSSAP